MTSWGASLLQFFKGFTGSRDGVAAPLFALALVGITGMSAFAVDMGHVYVVKRQIQASTDAAALAGAGSINCCTGTQAAASAATYSSSAGGKNGIPGVTVSMVTGYPKLVCLNAVIATGVPCDGVDKANAIVVQQKAVVPMFFAQMVGISNITVSASATAASKGAKEKNYDIMLVVDTTPSMSTPDASCSLKGVTQMTCALAGMQTLLGGLSLKGDRIGLMTFPGVTNKSQVSSEYTCNSTPQIASYANSPVYELISLSSDYQNSPTPSAQGGGNTSGSLNSSSNIVQASGVGGCGLQATTNSQDPGHTFFADVIAAAQAALDAQATPNSQKVIIFLSDGDSNAPAAYMTASKANNQCTQAIAAAQAAAADKIWVYSVAYNARTSGGCSTDKGASAITPCQTMAAIASDPSKFYSDTFGAKSGCVSAAHSVSELVSVFSSITSSLQSPRLLPDNTT